MTEILFILTTIFIAYVVYTIIGEQRASAKTRVPPAKPETPPAKTETHPPAAAETQHPVAVAQQKPAAAKPAAPKPATPKTTSSRSAAKQAAPKTTAKPAAPAKPAPVKKSAATAPAPAKQAGLKDPKTGEVVTAYTNYRFTKRWIKEALVAEGLVDKVYTAKELNPEVEAKIKEAIAKLEAMDKYQA
ncbi:MAG: hypothetical protein ACXWF8_11895 [Methylobacter sp.]